MSVTFATKCWGGDYQKFLSGAYERKLESLEYIFDREILILNNTENPDRVRKALEESATEEVYYALDLAHVFGGLEYSQPYALGEMVAMWVPGADPETATDYVCYVQGDVLTAGGDWVTPGIEILESEPDVLVVSPSSEVNTWHDREGYDQYMSDWAFVARTRDFRDFSTYRVPGNDPDYPLYAPNSFEALVGRYLKASGKKRKVLPEFTSLHPTW